MSGASIRLPDLRPCHIRRIADRLSGALGKAVRYVDISPEQMLDGLKELHRPWWQAEGLVEVNAHYRRGEAAEVTSG